MLFTLDDAHTSFYAHHFCDGAKEKIEEWCRDYMEKCPNRATEAFNELMSESDIYYDEPYNPSVLEIAERMTIDIAVFDSFGDFVGWVADGFEDAERDI